MKTKGIIRENSTLFNFFYVGSGFDRLFYGMQRGRQQATKFT